MFNIFKNFETWLFLRLLKNKKVSEAMQGQIAVSFENTIRAIDQEARVKRLDLIKLSQAAANDFIERWAK